MSGKTTKINKVLKSLKNKKRSPKIIIIIKEFSLIRGDNYEHGFYVKDLVSKGSYNLL